MNRWGIPDLLEKEVKDRDKVCVYCGIQMIEQTPPLAPGKLSQRGNTSSTTQVSSLLRILPDVASRAIQAKEQRSSLIGCSRVTVKSGESAKTRLRK